MSEKSDHKISEKDYKAIKTWLEQKWSGDHTCSVCGKTDWYISPHYVAAPVTSKSGEGVIFGGEFYPHVSIICANCSHTVFFNAIMMGLVKSLEDKTSEVENGRKE